MTQTLGELVRSVHDATTRALAHQELPFAQVVELARPDRDPARLPLVQVMFALEETWGVPDRGGLRWRPQLMENGTAKFEIELTVTDADRRVRLNYNTRLFDPATGQLVADGLPGDPAAPAPSSRRSAVAECGHHGPRSVPAGHADVWPDAGPVAGPGRHRPESALAAPATPTRCWPRAATATLTGRQMRDRADGSRPPLREHGVGRGRPGGASCCRAAPGCCRPSSASGRPAPPTCRWTRSIPAQRLRTMLGRRRRPGHRDRQQRADAPGLPPARGRPYRSSAWPPGCPPAAPSRVDLPPSAPPTSVHLRLDRPAEGGHRPPRRAGRAAGALYADTGARPG